MVTHPIDFYSNPTDSLPGGVPTQSRHFEWVRSPLDWCASIDILPQRWPVDSESLEDFYSMLGISTNGLF